MRRRNKYQDEPIVFLLNPNVEIGETTIRVDRNSVHGQRVLETLAYSLHATGNTEEADALFALVEQENHNA